MTRTEYRWLLPSAMADPGLPDDRARTRRTVRDWVVDITAFLCAAGFGLLVLAAIEADETTADVVVVVDSVIGAAACCALWVRRRWPVALAAVLTVVCIIEPVAAGALMVALFSLAVHRPFKPVAIVGAAALAVTPLQPFLRPDPATSYVASTIIGVLLVLLVLSWGMVVRSRRQLVVTLRERARRAEAEAELRAEQAQRLAREAIAREMHDVLAHRLTLLSVHAGALEFRPDAPAAEVGRAAGVIRDSAHEALQDLREIIGVLRGPGDTDEGDRPQPTLATLDALVAESRLAGMKVTVDNRVADPRHAPAATGRTVYRIVLAVLGGASHSAVSAAAHLLTWELSVQSDPDSTPARALFCDDPESDLALSRARQVDGTVDVAGTEVKGRLVYYRGAALPAAVLAEVWDRHFPVRLPVVRWLRLLADDPRPDVSMRAAVAAGELSVRDFEHGYTEVVRPLAEAPTPRRRVFAAAALDQAAGHASHRKAVRKVVDDWSRYGSASLRWTAAMALGYGRSADSMDDTLDTLARIGIRDDGELLAVASLNVVRLLLLPECSVVLKRLADWTGHRGEEYQDLALVTIVRLALTDVDDVLDEEPGTPLADRGDWPLLLALAATRPELIGRLADLFWTALNTARSQGVALDALEHMLRSATRKNGRAWTRPGLAALLPALIAEERDQRRLDWLLRRMMRDQDRPLTAEAARALWRLAVPARQRRSDEEESHG
ncbi:histidine kinase dimerization/phosphoacceptor domain-containing protein [Streptomyces fimicarius]